MAPKMGAPRKSTLDSVSSRPEPPDVCRILGVKRSTVSTMKFRWAALILFPVLCAQDGETLHNGIRLPSEWPPRGYGFSSTPRIPPYLRKPPAVIPINVGRQLFVDDFLIEQCSLRRTFHSAVYHDGNPIVAPDQPWEQLKEAMPSDEGRPGPVAMVWGDGVWWDPQDQLLKMWYLCGYPFYTCLATSTNGVHWTKPTFDVKPGTNIVQWRYGRSSTVWLDLFESDWTRRYKRFGSKYDVSPWDKPAPGKRMSIGLYYSPDGIHWSDLAATGARSGDRSTAYYDPFRRVWVASIRGVPDDDFLGRVRYYHEGRTAEQAVSYRLGEPVPWVSADDLDTMRPDLKSKPQLYNLDAVAYESLMLGLFSIWRGQPKDRPKPNEILVGFSRDGFHWDRSNRKVFVPVSERQGDWNYGNVQSAGGGCIVMRDKLYFYVSGRAGVPGTSQSGRSSTGLAILRRDGFASLDAGDEGGSVTTRPVIFMGKHLFVNLAAADGELRVEVLDADGRSVPGFSREDSLPLRADETIAKVHWRSGGDLSRLAGKPLRFRFHLRNGQLYSFWVSPQDSGASFGFVAAGGPGYSGPVDTVGRSALDPR